MPVKTDRFIEEEIPEPQPVEVIEHLVNHYDCPGCGKHIIARNSAHNSRFGKNLHAHVALLKYDDRLPLRKVTSALQRHYGICITNVGVLKVTDRVAKKLANPYKKLVRRIRKAGVVYADETELRIDGIAYYIWTFVTTTETIFVIRKSRAKKVVEEMLGKHYKGVICCDGWMAYSQYSTNLQRCWAHLLREAKKLAENNDRFTGFYTALKGLFTKINKIRAKPPPLLTRKEKREGCEKEMDQIIEQMRVHRPFKEFANKLKNGFAYWFTCVTNLLVEPTNNTAERALRELIVQRKIIGGLRREKGARIMETIVSMITTWKQRGLNTFTTMRAFM